MKADRMEERFSNPALDLRGWVHLPLYHLKAEVDTGFWGT